MNRGARTALGRPRRELQISRTAGRAPTGPTSRPPHDRNLPTRTPPRRPPPDQGPRAGTVPRRPPPDRGLRVVTVPTAEPSLDRGRRGRTLPSTTPPPDRDPARAATEEGNHPGETMAPKRPSAGERRPKEKRRSPPRGSVRRRPPGTSNSSSWARSCTWVGVSTRESPGSPTISERLSRSSCPQRLAQAQPGPQPALLSPAGAPLAPVALPAVANTERSRRVDACPLGQTGGGASDSSAGRRASKRASHSEQRNS